MNLRGSNLLRAAAFAAPLGLLAVGRTDERDEPAPCAPVESAYDGPAPFHPKAASQQWSIGEPTGEEQELLELMNRARIDPAGEGDRIFADYGSARVTSATDFWLKKRPGVEYTRAENRDAFHAYAAKQPFAFNAKLIDAARAHDALMKAHDQQAHRVVVNGAFAEPQLADRILATGYAPTFVAESIFTYASDMVHAHAGFAIDFGQDTDYETAPGVKVNCFPSGRPCLGHRLNLMGFDGDPGRDYREVGIAVIADASAATQVGPKLVSIEFAIPAAAPSAFVTGVVWDDIDGDGFYDAGEGVGGVRIDLDVGDAFAVSSASGGYAVPVIGAPGTIHVTATGTPGTPGGVIGTQTFDVVASGRNVKRDFQRPPDPPVPPMVEFVSGAQTAFNGVMPAVSTIAATLVAGESDLVGDVEVEVAIDHPAREHLVVKLVSPTGVEVVLFDHGAAGPNLFGTLDATLAPRNPFDPFLGGVYVGLWTLRCDADVADGDNGTLDWKLRVRPKWARPLFSHGSPLLTTKFSTVNSKKPAADSLTFAAVVTAPPRALGAAGPATLRVRTADATHAELFAATLPAAAIKRNVKDTSKTTINATVRKLDLPAGPFPATVELELAIDGLILSEVVPLTPKGAFNGATTLPTSDLFHVDSLTTKAAKGVSTYTIKGRLAKAGSLVGAGTLDVTVGSLRVRERMSKTKLKGKTTTFTGTGALKSVVVDPVKGAFTLVVATIDDLREMEGGLDVSLRLGDEGFFGSTTIVPAGTLSSLKY